MRAAHPGAAREVDSWEQFLGTRLAARPAALVDEATRARLLDAFPAMVRVRGDAVPLDYEVEEGQGVVVLRLREGQLRRLKAEDLPKVDRPLWFSVMRGPKPALRGRTLDELRAAIQNEPRERRGRHTELRGPRRGGRGGGGGGKGGRGPGRGGRRGR